MYISCVHVDSNYIVLQKYESLIVHQEVLYDDVRNGIEQSPKQTVQGYEEHYDGV
jgi:hypothetical protein